MKNEREEKGGVKKKKEKKGTSHKGETCRCEISWFCLRQRWVQIKKHRERVRKEEERMSSEKNAQRKQHNVKLSSRLISYSVGSHVVVGGLTPLSPWTVVQFLSL